MGKKKAKTLTEEQKEARKEAQVANEKALMTYAEEAKGLLAERLGIPAMTDALLESPSVFKMLKDVCKELKKVTEGGRSRASSKEVWEKKLDAIKVAFQKCYGRLYDHLKDLPEEEQGARQEEVLCFACDNPIIPTRGKR